MKTLVTVIALLSFSILCAQNMSYEEFQQEARINKRLLPKYGKTQKSDDELAADKAFIEKSIEEHKNVKLASKQMIKAGYHALEDDPKSAMINFNQAYLLDSSNADIYWGYGKLYYHFEQYEMAMAFYREGLELNPKSTMLLNSLGESCMAMHKADGSIDHMDDCIKKLQSSFMIDPSKAETSKLLTMAYLDVENCEKAKKYYQVYLATEKQKEDFELMERVEEECNLNQ